ncbi:MAG: SDR family oxidoreductase [Planctomycetes bacterium]|nr:SDR family oxidoreductase [Planctomycetota bacterium]
MARWLVTGGAGFIGSNIVHRLAADGERVRVLDDFSTGKRANLRGLPPARVQVIEGDLRDWRAVLAAVRGCDYVLHQGALGSVPRSLADPVTTTEVNVLGSVNVLEAARRAGCVKRVVLASSSSVYGDTPTLPKTEGMPLLPLSPYAASKAAMEGFARAFSASHGVEAVLLRYFNVFGPRQDPKGAYAAVIPRFFHAVLAGERPVIYGDGNQTRDFTYVDNVVEANLRAATVPRAAGEVLNVACGERVTILGLASLVAEALGTTTRPLLQPARGGEVRHSLADVERMESVLGFRPPVDLRRGLELAAGWYRGSLPGAKKAKRGK